MATKIADGLANNPWATKIKMMIVNLPDVFPVYRIMNYIQYWFDHHL
jgi:hypothetical protein